MADSIRTRVWEIADSYYFKRDWAHGRSHIERVLSTAVEIGKREGADLEIIELSAILHDIFANEEKRSGVEGFRHEVEALNTSKNSTSKNALTLTSAGIFDLMAQSSITPNTRQTWNTS